MQPFCGDHYCGNSMIDKILKTPARTRNLTRVKKIADKHK